MPVIHVRALKQPAGDDSSGCLRKLVERVAEILDVPSSKVFATWESLRPDDYVVGNVSADKQPRGTHPPIVTLTLFEGRPADKLERCLTIIADTLCEELSLEPGNAFVSVHELRSGTVYTGGAIKRR